MWPLLPGLLKAWLAEGWPHTCFVARAGLPPRSGRGIYHDTIDRCILGLSGTTTYHVAGADGPRAVAMTAGVALLVPAGCWVEPQRHGPARTCGLRLEDEQTVAYVATHRDGSFSHDSLWRRRQVPESIPSEARRLYAKVVAAAEHPTEHIADRHRIALVVDAATTVLAATLPTPRGAEATWRRIEYLIRNGEGDDRETLAQRAGISTSQLSRLVARFSDGNLRRLLNQQRVQRAALLMTSTDATIAAIAAACGFASPAHFAQRFREIHGRSPREWRRAKGGGGDP